MNSKRNHNTSGFQRLFLILKEADRFIETWVEHLINQLEELNQKNINQNG